MNLDATNEILPTIQITSVKVMTKVCHVSFGFL